MDPSVLANYLVDLSAVFNKFYEACPVMQTQRSEGNGSVGGGARSGVCADAVRAAINKAALSVMDVCLHLLGIDAQDSF